MGANRYVLTFSCRNRPGIVAAVSALLFGEGGNIDAAHQFDDTETGRFFMRVAFSLVTAEARIETLRPKLERIAEEYGMTWMLRDADARARVLLLVSRFDHCLADLLYRWRIGELAMDLAGIVSNYPRETFARHDLDAIAFDHLPVTRETKPDQEAALMRIVEERRVDLVVLARYMQVLSNEMSGKLAGRCINIHHSFLPGFKGARPYHQAFERGVKLIGATAHYVTGDLDEGPIIEQDVERISHADRPEDLVRKGRDIERRVLARAIALHLDGRVIPNGAKTVVFRD